MTSSVRRLTRFLPLNCAAFENVTSEHAVTFQLVAIVAIVSRACRETKLDDYHNIDTSGDLDI